jgi:sugar lactone lactonase YvrE
LRKLESKYPDNLVVIGVHSGKYHAERVTSRIADASLRLDAAHPVVNDRQFRVWRSYAVSAWPTLAVIDPAGYVVGMHAGEFTAEQIEPFIDRVIAQAKAAGTLKSGVLHPVADPPGNEPGMLRYPGKVAVDGTRIAISDSGNHRVLTGTLDDGGKMMSVAMTVGSGAAGFEDGQNARLNFPQGLVFSGDTLYVADAGNHAIRAVDLNNGRVSTVGGNGQQLRSMRDRDAGSLSSPWDIVVEHDSLYVAMAGTHQIWRIDLSSGKPQVHCGTGGEDIRDGNGRDALLAQPMGITAAGGLIHFTDAESSSVRTCEPSGDAVVTTIVGTGLFDFGDKDGIGDEVRLQHPQGITPDPRGGLLVADSYNDCIRHVDPATRRCTTVLRGFQEPGGLACSGSNLYVADTNAHSIAVVNLDTLERTSLTMR